MRTVQRTRFRRPLAVCSVVLIVGAMGCATASAAPYVPCPGGYIAPEIEDCPNIPQDRGGRRDPTPPGGGGGGGSVLGDLLDAIGLGGLGGLL